MKKLVLLFSCILMATMAFSQTEKEQERIKFLKMDTTQVDTSGFIKELTVDYVQSMPDTVKGVVLNIDQIEVNIATYAELSQVLRRQLRNYLSDYEETQNRIVQQYLKGKIEDTERELKAYETNLMVERERKRAFKKLIK